MRVGPEKFVGQDVGQEDAGGKDRKQAENDRILEVVSNIFRTFGHATTAPWV